jgi:DNA-binding response OmpR family regulator
VNAILCVDTDRRDLQKLSQLIRANGYICIPADTPEEAMRAFSSSRVDMVILDQGAEEGSLAGRLERLRDVPTLMLADNVARTQKPTGVDLLTPKPIHARELLSTIDVLLRVPHTRAA